MFELRIGSARESLSITPGWATHVVAIADPGPAAVPRLAPRFVLLRFADIETNSIEGPTREHVEEALDFTRDLGPDDRLLIHSVDGQRRGAALAAAILVQHGVSAEEALAKVDHLRSGAEPNRLICGFADLVLGTGGAIVRALNQRDNAAVAPVRNAGRAAR